MSLKVLNPNAVVLNKSNALHVNINATKGLHDVLKTNLGPKGTIRMLVGGAGDIKLTKDGNRLLKEMLLHIQEDNTTSFPQIQLKSLKKEPHFGSASENDKGDEQPRKENRPKSPKLESFGHQHHMDLTSLLFCQPGEIPVTQVPAPINSRLLEHQREGVKFLYNLYRNHHGGILGDDIL